MLQIMLRVIAVYVFFLVVFRLLGKRELSQLSPFELVTLMLIPETVSNGISGQTSLVSALVGASTVFLLVIFTSVVAHRFQKVEVLFESEPTVLVRAGKLCQRAMNVERIQPAEIFGEMHQHGYRDLSEIDYAILESGGEITFVPKRRQGHP